MDIVYSLYDRDLPYDGLNDEEEEKIIDFIKSHLGEDYYQYDISSNNDTYFQNELSSRSLNSINWYPISKGNKVLEVLGRFGTLTQWLLKKEIKLTCLETVKKRAEINYMRNKCENLKLICTSDILECEVLEKYDYIILSNVIENAKAIINIPNISAKTAVKLLLEKLSRLLNTNGKILIYTENKFGIKYFAGFKNYNVENSFDNIVDSNNSKINKYFSKNELVNILNELGMNNYKFYYPLPDNKNTSVIYSDDYLPNANSSKLKYNIRYNKFNTIVFNETEALLQITKSGYFDIFANSYIIEISKKNCDINFVGFNNFRSRQYQLMTLMKKNKIIKSNCYIEGNEHINNIQKNIDKLNEIGIKTLDSYDEGIVISRYTDAKSLDNILYDKIINNGEEEYISEINRWYEFINNKLNRLDNINNINNENIFNRYNIEISDEDLNKLTFVKNGFLDMIFENIFVINDEYYIYDQEWYEENIPLEYILYRAIQSLYFHNRKIESKYSKSKLFEYFKISEFIELFDKLENKWQESIIDRITLEYFENTYSVLTTLESLNNTKEDLKFYSRIVDSQNEIIEQLKSEKEKLEEEIRQIKSSHVWKLYEKIPRRKNENKE